MVRYRIQIDTTGQMLDMIHKMCVSDKPIYLTNSDRTKVLGAHSILSELTALDFDEVWVESDDESLYEYVKEYVI